MDRRDFLRLAAGGAAVATSAGCRSGSGSEVSAGQKAGAAGAKKRRILRIALWDHAVPDYDAWFDHEFVRDWGDAHGVEVLVDHIPLAEVVARADTEVAARGPHDIFSFVDPPPAFEDEVIDHREIVEELERRFGKLTPLVQRSVFNPRTKKYFAAPDYWVARPVHYRADLWSEVASEVPSSWDDLLRFGPELKARGFPLGIGLSPYNDSSWGLFSLLYAFGVSVQDEDGGVTINQPGAVEAVELMTRLYRTSMTGDILNWDDYSNNRFLASGQGALILNPISALRAAETQDPVLASRLALAPALTASAGPGVVRSVGITGVNVIWRFSEHQDLARQFLVDLGTQQRESFVRSGFYNLPAYPGAVPDLVELTASDDLAQPAGKYALLAHAEDWCTNLGHPGHANAAIDECFSQFVIPKAFAAAARGELSPQDAVKTAEAEIQPIFEKWRERGKI